MTETASAEWPRPQEKISAAPLRRDRPTLGPGYDWLLELMRQMGRPAAFVMCLLAGFYQILAPPELRLDGVTFGIFMGLLGAMCGIRAAELSLPSR